MTTGALRAGTAPREDSAEAAVRAFFTAYRAHDVEGMVDLCADNAGFRYVPFEVWGRQRVLHGEGKVCTVGKVIWTTLIDAFPDLTNAVTNQEKHVDLDQAWILMVTPDDRVSAVIAYWDQNQLYRRLGVKRLDKVTITAG